MRRVQTLALGFLATVLLAVGVVALDQRQVHRDGERTAPVAAGVLSPGSDPFGKLR